MRECLERAPWESTFDKGDGEKRLQGDGGGNICKGKKLLVLSYVFKMEASKTEICYTASFLHTPSYSLIFSKLEVNDENGTTCELNFTKEYLKTYLIKPTQKIINFQKCKDEFLLELQYIWTDSKC